jgi:putative peptidoglycan lipid II flippase
MANRFTGEYWVGHLRWPVIDVLFGHGAFDRAAINMVSAPVVWYTFLYWLMVSASPFGVIYAQRDTRIVIAVNGLQTAIRLVADVLLVRFMGYNGLALSAVIG